MSQLHGLDCDRNMVRRPHHLLVSCSGPALVSASSSGTMISAVSPAAHSQITLRGHRVVPAQCSPGHCYGALPQTEWHCSLGARQSLLQILLIHQVRSWLIFTRWFQITHSGWWWWDSGTCVVWNTIISYDKKYFEGMWFKVYMTNAFKGVNHCLKASGRRYLGALLYLAVHHLLSRDNLRVRANDRDLSMSSEIPITNPFLFLENMFQKENILIGSHVVLPRQLDCFHLANPELGWSVTIAMFFRTNINQTHWSFIIGNSVIYTATQSLNKSLEVASFFPQINIECLSLSSRARLSRV